MLLVFCINAYFPQIIFRWCPAGTFAKLHGNDSYWQLYTNACYSVHCKYTDDFAYQSQSNLSYKCAINKL